MKTESEIKAEFDWLSKINNKTEQDKSALIALAWVLDIPRNSIGKLPLKLERGDTITGKESAT